MAAKLVKTKATGIKGLGKKGQDYIERTTLCTVPPQNKQKLVKFYEPEDPVDGGKNAARLLFKSGEVEVKRYREQSTRWVRNMRVSKALSPYVFFIDFDFDRPSLGYRDWRVAMQHFYKSSKEEELENFRVKTSILLKYRCYAYLDSETDLWERVRVMKYDMKHHRAEVYLFEQNEFRIVPKSSIMELNPEFATWTAQAFPSHLLNIRPAKNAKFWSSEACKYFNSLVEGKSFTTVVITRTRVPFPEGFPEVVEYFGVAMIQRNPRKKITLQAEMVKAGFAEPTGVLAGYKEMMELAGAQVGTFDLYAFEKEPKSVFASPGNMNPRPTPTAEEVKDMMEKTMKKTEVLQESVRSSEVKKNEPTSSETETETKFIPSIYQRDTTPIDDFSRLPTCYKDAMCQVRFSHMICPSVLYCQLIQSIDELREMETALGIVVQNSDPIPFDDCIAGLETACHIQIDPNREPTYVRAVIRHSLPGVKLLKVILVDYGLDISVKHNFARHLPSYFKKIPAFAFRVHLDSATLIPTGGKQWSSDGSDTFRRYMDAWDKHIPIYYAWMPPNASNIELEDFNQELHWDHLIQKWEPTSVRYNPLNVAINSMNECPLLQNLYNSVGIDIMYEIVNTDDKNLDYAFESLGDVLCDCGFALRLSNVNSIDAQHIKIVTNLVENDHVVEQKLFFNTE